MVLYAVIDGENDAAKCTVTKFGLDFLKVGNRLRDSELSLPGGSGENEFYLLSKTNSGIN